ncbi:MAG TPA: family 43 glycosylhydrolase, partial [Candidatus Synoicihabitans sp.]|nr:family 43 glycosylhydrolase [Candidatus Synoicihabitans sp.]
SFHPHFGWLVALIVIGFTSLVHAQNAPSHDPSRMIRNNDGRYWIFTTGQGVWAMSSSNADFTNWRAEPAVFPSGWPSWIANYVSGFNGNFWAPDVVKMGSTYYLYYSCAGNGAPAAIGLATATNLSGPWTDRGMIVAGNNAIDPAVLIDGSNVWLSYGNWQTGIDIIQINPSNGLRQGTGRWDLVNGEVEGPYIIRNGSFYYLFFQSGLCCSGLNSTYHVRVGRSTSPNGNYVDKNGVSLLSGGGTVFIPNRDGRFVGPGHIGLGEGRLTYHFYDGNDNGNAKLRVTTLSWGSDGWPIAAGVNVPSGAADGTYRIRNRASGKYLDNLSVTTNGAGVGQWASSSSSAQRWQVTTVGGYRKLICLYGNKRLDSLGRTGNDTQVGQWDDSSSTNQQWTIQDVGGGYFKIVNRANGLCLDTGGTTSDGAIMEFWASGSSYNQHWQLVAP